MVQAAAVHGHWAWAGARSPPGREPGALARLPRSSASALEDVETVEHRKALDYGEMAVFMADR